MQPDKVPSRDEYIDQLIEGSLRDAEELEAGLLVWSEKHVPIWREQGRDEEWIRMRIEKAQQARKAQRELKAAGYTQAQRRKLLREVYEDMPVLYTLMLQRIGRSESEVVHLGTEDPVQRSALRLMVYDADRAAFEGYCRWAGGEIEPFEEGNDRRFIHDLSTVEELEMALKLAKFLSGCFEETPRLTAAQIDKRMYEFGKQLRQEFIAQFGYPPEDSTTPRVPVTVDGPVDRDEYMASEYEREHGKDE